VFGEWMRLVDFDLALLVACWLHSVLV